MIFGCKAITWILALVGLVSVLNAQTKHAANSGTFLKAADVIYSSGGSGSGFVVSGTDNFATAQCCITFSLGDHSVQRNAHYQKGMNAKLVDASALPLEQAKLAPAVYIALAKEIEMEGPSVDEAMLLEAISQLGLKVYDFDKVDSYLTDKALSISQWTRWVWKPLRQKDSNKLTGLNRGGTWDSGSGVITNSMYAQEFPAQQMLKVRDVLAKMPNVIFLVSDYETVKPDPFLAVTTSGLLHAGKVWIIGRWDEPGFGKDDEALTRLIASK